MALYSSRYLVSFEAALTPCFLSLLLISATAFVTVRNPNLLLFLTLQLLIQLILYRKLNEIGGLELNLTRWEVTPASLLVNFV